MRDPVKVAAEMSARNEKILEAAFELFSERAIEAISMNEVAAAAEIGIATLYRYYGTKQKLAFAVNEVQWKRFCKEIDKICPLDSVPALSAKEWLNQLMDLILIMFEKEKKMMRFIYYLDSYARQKPVPEEVKKQYYEVLQPITNWYQWMREQAEKDHTIRTDLSSREFMRVVITPLFSTASKYALDGVWSEDKDFDAVSCLEHLKNALVNYACIGAEA